MSHINKVFLLEFPLFTYRIQPRIEPQTLCFTVTLTNHWATGVEKFRKIKRLKLTGVKATKNIHSCIELVVVASLQRKKNTIKFSKIKK